MTPPPTYEEPVPYDPSPPADPLALLATLAEQRGSFEALDTLDLICQTLSDEESPSEIEQVVRAVQDMTDAGVFTRAEHCYIVSTVSGVGIDLELSYHPRLQELQDEAEAIENRHDRETWLYGRPEPDASTYDRLNAEIDAITREAQAAAFSLFGETAMADQVLEDPDEFGALLGCGLQELEGSRRTDRSIDDDEEDPEEMVRIFMRSSPDELMFLLTITKGKPRAKLVWNALREIQGPDATLQDVEPLVRLIQRIAAFGQFTRDERHYLIGNLAERKAPQRARELPEFVKLEARIAQLRVDHAIDPEDEWDFVLAPRAYRELTKARDEQLKSIESDWLQSVGEREMARLLAVDSDEYLDRLERGWSALFGVTVGEVEEAREEKRRREVEGEG